MALPIGLDKWIRAQEPRLPKMRDAPVFYRNLEETLDARRAENNLITLRTRKDSYDFFSNDFLSLEASGMLREAFFEELALYPGFKLGSTGSRLLDGNNDYIETIEHEIAKGERCVIISVETVYSMDGDICSLKEMVEIAKSFFPRGNAQFIVDEAHSTGVIGEKGRGLVSHLGLENEIAIRLHTFSKALVFRR
ncbi:pyridoxal phosphate-dependent transferase [Pseudomassariella vexata]|uniref:Pyridoxal phosphate-dependent transferase n=1 Tax=Pseudomassariella vexata TaxID=1141098 RepID=A0A1Y2DGF4_9PEZI|nr:pyridoxal phosphate-dependent transferase [Pseudomassariella vexata]ORY58373.1 pyridoxal phosphate-dependent transferase [Pseudomassariella vexata]